jgi:hypothetical protein
MVMKKGTGNKHGAGFKLHHHLGQAVITLGEARFDDKGSETRS